MKTSYKGKFCICVSQELRNMALPFTKGTVAFFQLTWCGDNAERSQLFCSGRQRQEDQHREDRSHDISSHDRSWMPVNGNTV